MLELTVFVISISAYLTFWGSIPLSLAWFTFECGKEAVDYLSKGRYVGALVRCALSLLLLACLVGVVTYMLDVLL